MRPITTIQNLASTKRSMEGSEHEHEYEYEYSRKKKNRNRNKRRFSDEQIRSLEMMFENETRVEPRKKIEVARELGLQPRQVAIWFQNKRARYKSKQLEQEYGVLRANYNNLASRFENLKSEKQALLIQLQKLNELMHKSEGEGRSLERDIAENNVEGKSDNNNNKVEFEEKPSLCIEQGSGTKGDYFGVEEEQKSLVELVEAADSSLTSAEDWGNFDSDDIFNQSTTGYQWWDFWS